MGLRQTINEKPALAGGVSVAIVVLAILIVVWQMHGSCGEQPRPALSNQDYFTTDDGQTFYPDSLDNIPPYKHEGKEAVRAFVFKCGSGAPFAGYLQRATASGRKQYSTFGRSSRVTASNPAIFEVKKPGKANQWVPVDNDHSRQWRDIIQVKCPNGTDSPAPVIPGR